MSAGTAEELMCSDTWYRDHCFSQAQRLVQPLQPAELIPLVTRPWYHGLEVYALCKQIDGMPGVDGTPLLAGCRASRFLSQRQRQFFYEPVGDPEKIQEQLVFNQALRRGYAPKWSLPQITMAIEVFDSIYTAPEGTVQLPSSGEKKVGRHAVTLTGGWKNMRSG